MQDKQKINLSIPSSTAIADAKGNLKPEWRLWFNKLYQRLGGDSAYSNGDLGDIAESINNQINDIESSIKNITNQLTSYNTSIGNINVTLNQLKTTVNTFNDSISQNANNVVNLQASVSSINTQLTTINTTLTDLQNQINANKDSIDQINILITSINMSIDQVNSRIDAITSQIGELITQLNANTAAISDLQTNTSTNTTAISTLTTQVGTNTSDISDLKTSVIKTIASVGSGIVLWSSTLANTAKFKSIQAGTNITLDNTTDPNTIIINGGSLPIASSSILGGIKVGSGLAIATDGTLSNNYSYNLPIANTTTLGGIKIGAGLSIAADGTVSASGGGGSSVQEGTGTGHNSSVIYSQNGLQANTTGIANSGVGYNSLMLNTTGNNNTAMGHGSMYGNVDGNNNTTMGYQASYNNNHGNNNTVVGYQAGFNSTYGSGSGLDVSNNTFFGYQAGYRTVGGGNVAIGFQALYGAASGAYGGQNIAIGQGALFSNGNATGNVAVGSNSLYNNQTGQNNFGLGASCLYNNTTGSYNTGIGVVALRENTTGTGNIGIGLSSYRYSNANYQTGVGYLSGTNTYWDNTTCIGANTDCTAANQVQLGSSTTTTYVYGTVQNRSDARDKANIRDGELGLDFIKSLKYKQWQWNFREDYKIKHIDQDGNVTVEELPNDGSKTRKRFHNGFIAQDIKQIMLLKGIDFAGYQDHNIINGEDILSLGYDEFIGPLVKAIQEQQLIIEQLQKDIASLKNP